MLCLVKKTVSCEKCGAPLDYGVNFCEHCGALVRDRQTGVDSRPTREVSIQCPKCCLSDSLSTVFSIYQRDNISLDNYGVWANVASEDREVEGNHTSQQKAPLSPAKMLAPPEKPEYTSGVMKWLIVPFVPVLNFICIWFAPMSVKTRIALVINGVLVLIAICVSTGVESRLRASGNAFYAAVEEELKHVGPFTILDAPYLLGLLLLLIYYTGVISENIRRKKHFFFAVVPAHQKAMARWRGLNYCARCNIVFTSEPLPGRPGFAMVNRVKVLLYEDIN